jgi:hypothetical protein
VIIVGKAAARPAKIWYVDSAKRFDDVGAQAARIGNRRLFPDPDAVVDASTQVLGEVTIQVPANLPAVLIAMNDDLRR